MKNQNISEQHLNQFEEIKKACGEIDRQIKISILLNAIHYFLDCVFIIHSYRRYRLLVLNSDNIIVDQHYTSLKGAKIAFHQIYRSQACIKGTKAVWDEYIPEQWWIKKKMKILEKKLF
jgi:hypothetical protein